MTDKEIIEGNKLIAEFMGFKLVTRKSLKYKYWEKETAEGVEVLCSEKQELKFHKDWSMLMPVVEKIESMDDGSALPTYVSLDGKKCSIRKYYSATEILRKELSSPTFSVNKLGKTKLEGTWLAVVDFIKWYDENKSPLTGNELTLQST